MSVKLVLQHARIWPCWQVGGDGLGVAVAMRVRERAAMMLENCILSALVVWIWEIGLEVSVIE